LTTPRRVVVIGGGLAGITAALDCADAGADVTLLEARGWLGGATFSIERDGLWMDNGQHVFLRCFDAYRSLLARLGVGANVVLQERLEIPVLESRGRVARLRRSGLPAPFHLAGALARYRVLSARERLAAARAARALGRLDPADPALDARTFGDWLCAHGQSPRAIEAVWDLIALPTLNLYAREASLALAVKVFTTGLLENEEAGDVGYAAVPLARLHGDPAQRRLEAGGAEVRIRARAATIEAGGDGFVVRVDGSSLEAKAVVLAVPHDEAARLLPPGALANADALSRLGSSPIVNLHIVYDRKVLDLPFAAGLRTPVQFVFDRTRSGGLDGDGQYIAVSLSCARDYARRPVDELRREFVPALADLLPPARGATVERFFVTREQQATFLQAPGTAALRPPARTGLPGLALAGAWTDTGWPATMEGAVLSGHAAARLALAQLRGADSSRPSRTRQEVA
jgi:squalene-associated FAD-dependent desaturase